MKIGPLIFSVGASVRGLLREARAPGSGKTQTRRMSKHLCVASGCRVGIKEGYRATKRYAESDLLYVLEPWQTASSEDGPCILYRADLGRWRPGFTGPEEGAGPSFDYARYPGSYSCWVPDVERSGPWRPGRDMPRWMSRLTLRVSNVRVERLRSISEESAIAEGVCDFAESLESAGAWENMTAEDRIAMVRIRYGSCRRAFQQLFELTNGSSLWEANPWVVVVEHQAELKNVDAILDPALEEFRYAA